MTPRPNFSCHVSQRSRSQCVLLLLQCENSFLNGILWRWSWWRRRVSSDPFDVHSACIIDWWRSDEDFHLHTNFPDDRQWKFKSLIRSVPSGIECCLDQLQCNRCENQFIEISLKSLVWLSLNFPLPAIIVYYNNAIKTLWCTFYEMLLNTLTSLQSLMMPKPTLDRARPVQQKENSFNVMAEIQKGLSIPQWNTTGTSTAPSV